MAVQIQDDQPEYTYSSYVRIRDVAPKTCQRRWTMGRSGERGSGISVLATRHDDDDKLIQSILKTATDKSKINKNIITETDSSNIVLILNQHAYNYEL